MSDAYTGGCACGAIRYEIRAEPIVMVDCQCRQCQRQSSTGHSSYLTFQAAEVTLSGNANHWLEIGEGGTKKSCGFCPNCGSPLYIAFPDVPDLFAVRAGSLDDPTRYKPQIVTWTLAGHPWDRVDPDLPKFDKLPPA
jgi:hypothetical protein